MHGLPLYEVIANLRRAVHHRPLAQVAAPRFMYVSATKVQVLSVVLLLAVASAHQSSHIVWRIRILPLHGPDEETNLRLTAPSFRHCDLSQFGGKAASTSKLCCTAICTYHVLPASLQ